MYIKRFLPVRVISRILISRRKGKTPMVLPRWQLSLPKREFWSPKAIGLALVHYY